MSKEIESKILEILEAAKIGYTVDAAGIGLKCDEWECDGWRVTIFPNGGGLEHFDYYTGTGHREVPKAMQSQYKRLQAEHAACYNKRSIDAARIRQRMESMKLPEVPHIASVLHSLLLDSQAIDESFVNWCDDFGYDSDSIKALGIYNACCENARKLRRVFDRETLARLSETLHDY